MAGFFDAFTNMSPEQNQGLLAAAAALLQAGGPSRMPTSFGQALGGGLQAYQQGLQGAEDRKTQLEQQRINSRLLGLKMQDAESDLANQAAQRERAKRLQEFYQQGAGPNFAQMAAATGGSLAPTVENAGKIQQAMPSSGGPNNLFAARLDEAQRLRAAGFGPEADAAEAAALKFQPKVKGWEKVTQNGRVLFAPFFEDGTSGPPVPLDVAEKLQEVNLGGSTQLVNPFTGEPVKSLRKTATPGEIMTNERLKEQNAIASGQKVATTSTALRKEFDDLPEVKNYKQALPAYTAIVDASKRNTPQADINLVYGIAKLYDPGSVVREGEYNTVANSPNIPDRIKGYAQYLAGGGKLTPAVKQQILQEATGRIGSYENEYSAARNNYSDIAARSGADPSLLFPSSFKPAAEKAQASTAKKISLADIAATARASGRTTAEVTAAARAKGYTIGD